MSDDAVGRCAREARISEFARIVSQRDNALYECDALRAANRRLEDEVEQLRIVRDKQRVEIEFLHDCLRRIVLLAQRMAQS